MKLKDLTPEQKEYFKAVYTSEDYKHKEKTDILSFKFNIAERTVRKWAEVLDIQKFRSDLTPQLRVASEKEIDKNTKIVFVTTAQNKTMVNSLAFNKIKKYADFLTAKGHKTEIIVIPSRYRNPTNNIEDDKTKAAMWWESDLENYLVYGKLRFGDVLISADTFISPTAKEPLKGFELLANKGHLVLGHSKIHWKTLPRLKGQPLRTMCTTGYITTRNYSKSKAGDVAFENHSLGFVVLELKKDGTCSIPRNVKMNKDGDFTDIIYEVTDKGVQRIDSCEALVLGDMHTAVLDKEIFDDTLDLCCNVLNPKRTFAHDVLDGYSFNPHEEKDMYIKRQKIINGTNIIANEIETCFKYLEKLKTCSTELFVVESNHDVFTDRHVNNFNWKNDLYNSPMYLKLAYIQQTEDLTEHGNIFGFLLNERFKGSIKYLPYGSSYVVNGYELALHGDVGISGSRGNTITFNRVNTKMIHAHTHAPMIYNNVTCVGIMALLWQHYNRKGFSTWAHAHSVVHNTGKNQLLVYGDDKKISVLL